MPQTFGTLLRDLRKRSGMTQDELARRLGYSRQMVSALETDERLPDLEAVEKHFAHALGLEDSRRHTEILLELALHARRQQRLAGLSHTPLHRGADRADLAQAKIPYISVPSTPLLGRDRDVKRLTDRLNEDAVRLITLVGPPGVGKTRLAQTLASRLSYTCNDGGVFVPLASVTNPDHFASALLAALDARNVSGEPLPAAISLLRRRDIVLVLDNFEQLLPASPQIARLVDECPGVRIIVTSRERLRLRSENTARVRPLDQNYAVDLFLERARAAGADEAHSKVELEQIAEICRLLDCLPLAIELCAAQAEYSSIEEILVRIRKHPLDSLSNGAIDLPPHQQTLRAAIQRSYEMLNEDERSLLRALSIFVGGCTTEMAVEVWCDEEDGTDLRFDAALRGLVAKNLVQFEATTLGERRLTLLESIREFGYEQLARIEALDGVRALHFECCYRFARRIERGIWTADCSVWLKRFAADIDNFFLALAWARDAERWHDLGVLVVLLFQPFDAVGRLAEYINWMELVLSSSEQLGPDVELALKSIYIQIAQGESGRHSTQTILAEFRALVDACQSPGIKADSIRFGVEAGVYYPKDLEALQEGVSFAHQALSSNPNDHPIAYNFSGIAALTQAQKHVGIHLVNGGEGIESNRMLLEVLALEREYGYVLDVPTVLWFLGRAALIRGDDWRAYAYFQEALALSVDTGDERFVVLSRAFLGLTALYLGDSESAEATLRKARTEAIVFGDPYCLANPTLFLTEYAIALGRTDEAYAWFTENVAAARQAVRDLPWQKIHRMLLGALLAAISGNDRLAATLYGAAQSLNDRIKLAIEGPVRNSAALALAVVRARLGEDAWRDALEVGYRLAPEELHAALASLVTDSPHYARRDD